MSRSAKIPSERFWVKVLIPKLDTDCCWEWQAGTFSNGYGQFYDGKNKIGAHRFSYQDLHGEVPKSLLVCHKCDNRLCVRPSHLFLGTQKENLQDMINKNRQVNTGSKGELNGRAIANENIVIEMRKLHKDGESIAGLARKFSISEAQTSRIVKRESWSFLP